MANARGHTGRGFGLYLLLTGLICPLVPLLLRRRLKKGKELPDRWIEKLGQPTLTRPQGPLIWMHAVGLGEALALRALIVALKSARPDLNILVTSSTRSSAEALAANGLSGAIHQFLPLDCPRARRRFLEHWRPDLAVWSEQDIWPGFVHAAAKRGIPQVWINARMNADAHRRRARMPRLYRATYQCFARISAQDGATAGFISDLGASAQIGGSLKPAAAPLSDKPKERLALIAMLAGRRVWLAASSHPEDERVALDAYRNADAPGLLVIAPRYPHRGSEIETTVAAMGLSVRRRSNGETPDAATEVYIADTTGEMGLWYRLADMALIGGTFSDIQGHNPWEAAALGCAILHGPRTENFSTDYNGLDGANAATLVRTAPELVHALGVATTRAQPERAKVLVQEGRKLVELLATQLLSDMDARAGTL
ncbi:MAG: 3-deoxy-D-manno-octulosonic acid transferase [Thalassovita sp.]